MSKQHLAVLSQEGDSQPDVIVPASGAEPEAEPTADQDQSAAPIAGSLHQDVVPMMATTPDAVRDVVAGYPHSPHERGVVLYDFIREHKLTRMLELGFNHGVSTCYAAAAMASLGGGHIVTIDRMQAAAYDPGLEVFLGRLGLRDFVTPFYEASSYNWRLRDLLGRQPIPEFDLVFLDGGHLFEPDALAFLLAERMLRPGGYFIFDDINWSMASSPTASPDPLRFGPEEVASRQVREVVDLLVRPHPNIAEWTEDRKWGFARKKTEAELGGTESLRRSLADDARRSRLHALQTFPEPIQVARDLAPVDWQRTIQNGLRANAQARASR